jgi:hypothetical protein
MFNVDGNPVARYWLQKAWPSKMEVAGLKASSSIMSRASRNAGFKVPGRLSRVVRQGRSG